MSYCRFGWDDSDVYVFGTGDRIECCACLRHRSSGLPASFIAETEQEMIDHLLQHRALGDTVPQAALDRLEAERDGVEYQTTVEEAIDEIRRNPQMFGKTPEEMDAIVDQTKQMLEELEEEKPQ